MRYHLFAFLIASSFLATAAQAQINAPRPSHLQPALFSKPPKVLEELRQNWNLTLGLNGGGSLLFPNIDFSRTGLKDVYDFIRLNENIPALTWEEFLDGYEIRKVISQPRYGFSARLTYGNLPLFVDGEVMTSTSSYQKFAYSVTPGIGGDFVFGNDFFFGINGGVKFMLLDGGFGSETVSNSFSDDEEREALERFYDPKFDLGAPIGKLASMRVSVGKYFGGYRRVVVGLENYGELDLTDETIRVARMTNIGINAFMRFAIF